MIESKNNLKHYKLLGSFKRNFAISKPYHSFDSLCDNNVFLYIINLKIKKAYLSGSGSLILSVGSQVLLLTASSEPASQQSFVSDIEFYIPMYRIPIDIIKILSNIISS